MFCQSNVPMLKLTKNIKYFEMLTLTTIVIYGFK